MQWLEFTLLYNLIKWSYRRWWKRLSKSILQFTIFASNTMHNSVQFAAGNFLWAAVASLVNRYLHCYTVASIIKLPRRPSVFFSFYFSSINFAKPYVPPLHLRICKFIQFAVKAHELQKSPGHRWALLVHMWRDNKVVQQLRTSHIWANEGHRFGSLNFPRWMNNK